MHHQPQPLIDRQMLFTDNDEEPENKEVWITEYNLHDGLELGDPTDPDIQTLENM